MIQQLHDFGQYWYFVASGVGMIAAGIALTGVIIFFAMAGFGILVSRLGEIRWRR